MLIFRQFGFELFKLYARRRTHIGFGAFLALQLLILGLLQHPRAKAQVAALLDANGLDFADHYRGLTLAIVIIAFSFTFLGGLYVALVAGDIVAKEVEDGTLRLVLARPVSRVRLLLVKLAACVTYSLSLVAFLGCTALIFASVYRGGARQAVHLHPRRRAVRVLRGRPRACGGTPAASSSSRW